MHSVFDWHEHKVLIFHPFSYSVIFTQSNIRSSKDIDISFHTRVFRNNVIWLMNLVRSMIFSECLSIITDSVFRYPIHIHFDSRSYAKWPNLYSRVHSSVTNSNIHSTIQKNRILIHTVCVIRPYKATHEFIVKSSALIKILHGKMSDIKYPFSTSNISTVVEAFMMDWRHT